ncbi:MAG: molecular chaperone, partial [Oscillospiraceae bacterium]|nr:molecular chaperone [Oscillospiraceae bacterium]
DQVLMELKTSGGIPMWMVQFLSRERVYKTSFSKYGTAYQNYIAPALLRQYAQYA